jgi:hypothetical protein
LRFGRPVTHGYEAMGEKGLSNRAFRPTAAIWGRAGVTERAEIAKDCAAVRTSAIRSASDNRPPRIRSAVSNGRRLFVEGDGNSAWSRRYRDLIVGHVNDMGGADLLSESEKSLIRRASAIECELEQMEGLLSRREPVDLDAFTRAAGHLRRILETLGLQRRQRDAAPSLADYLSRYASASPEDEPEGECGAGEPSGEKRTSGHGTGNGSLVGPESHPSEDSDDEGADA